MCDPKEEKTSTADNHPGLGSLEIEDVTTEMKQPPLPLGDADTADDRNDDKHVAQNGSD